MMGTAIRGADLERLGTLGSTLGRQALTLQGVMNSSTFGVSSLERLWQGPDSAQFKRRWMSIHRPRLVKAIAELEAAAATIERNRQAQERTSAADGGGTGGAGGTAPLAGGGGEQSGGNKIDDDVRIVGWDPVTGQPLFASPDGSEGSIHPNDIDQQSLGDCYFVSSLAGIANHDPDMIRDAIVDNGDGTYTVTLYEEVDGELQPVEVTVDGGMPQTQRWDSETETWIDSDRYTAGEADSELWPRIFEKAYAQQLGDGDLVAGYGEIIGGDGADALEALTGVESQTVGTGGLSIDELREMHDNGVLLPASQRHIPGSGWMGFGKDTGNYDIGDDEFVTRHQYWVEDIRDDGTIVVRNPWGYDDYEYELTLDEFNDAFREVDYNPAGG